MYKNILLLPECDIKNTVVRRFVSPGNDGFQPASVSTTIPTPTDQTTPGYRSQAHTSLECARMCVGNCQAVNHICHVFWYHPGDNLCITTTPIEGAIVDNDVTSSISNGQGMVYYDRQPVD